MYRKRLFISLILIVFLSGCATSRSSSAVSANKPAKSKSKVTGQKPLPASIEKIGMIFGKTEFLGILKTSYVKLYLADQVHPKRKYILHIGERMEQEIFRWQMMPVKPGYYFINLPVGKYKIYAVGIPVGSTMAIEDMDIAFEVFADKAVYVGTLRVLGTKERIKVGGVPVIKPGF